jgi:ActR/RegA family two-component response regulator
MLISKLKPGAILGITAAELTFRGSTIFVIYKGYGFISTAFSAVKLITIKYKRSDSDQSKIFNDICDNYDSFNY